MGVLHGHVVYSLRRTHLMPALHTTYLCFPEICTADVLALHMASS